MSWSARPTPRRSLPDDVRRAREEDERVNESNRQVLEPLIGAHLTAYAAALGELDEAHRLVADETTLQLDAETRQAAMWLVAGRCIGLGRAAHQLASTGYVVETIPVLRSLHEAARLLTLVTHRGEDDVVNRWLRGRHVSRGEIMAAIHRQEEAARVEMIQQGIAPPSTTRDYLEGQYGRWSEFAHHRRRHMLTQFSLPARIMVTGPHPDWRSRATMVDQYGWYLAELVSAGGSALGRLLGPTWFHERFQPTFEALFELKRRIPLADIASGGQPPPGSTP
jgi:hypothetical protein